MHMLYFQATVNLELGDSFTNEVYTKAYKALQQGMITEQQLR